MLSQKLKTELDSLVEVASKQGYRLNSITLYNIYAALPSQMKNDTILPEMEAYLALQNVVIVSDGVEIDDELPNQGIEIRPFDPSKIDIAIQNITMDILVKRIKNDEIALNTEFQRKAGLWTAQQKSQLIESLLLKIPLPAFYFDAEAEDHWLIIDGLQRITTFKEFMIDETLQLEGLEFFRDLNELRYSQLPRSFSRRIEETNLVAYTVRRGTPDNVKYNVFKRINTGGLELTPQEIRHALFQGQATKILDELSKSDAFKRASSWSIRTDRMLDQEFVLRFIAVCFYGIEKYNGLPDDFLNDAMKELNQMNLSDLDTIRTRFYTVMSDAYEIFDNQAFRKMGKDGRRRPINKAVFEIWCKTLFALSGEEIKILIKNREDLKRRFIELCESDYFINILRASDKKSYMNRFFEVHTLVKEAIKC